MKLHSPVIKARYRQSKSYDSGFGASTFKDQ